MQAVEVHSGHEYYGITIRFTDQTALNFTFEPCAFTFPVYSGWTGGNEEILKKYKSVRSHIQRSEQHSPVTLQPASNGGLFCLT